MNVVITNVFGFLRASRIPNLVLIAVAQVFTGLYLLSNPVQDIISINFIILILTTQMIAAAGYIINDYYDQKIDMINRPEKVIVGVSLKRRMALISHAVLNVTAVSLAYFIDLLIVVIHLGSSVLLWAAHCLSRSPAIG